jgi:hypothetical protein
MINVEIASPPDREYMTAPLMVEYEQLAEVDQESGSLAIEFYPRRDGQPWRLDFEEVIAALLEARKRLGY